jgi:hypothetical protein
MKKLNMLLTHKEDQEENAPVCPPRKPSAKMSKSLEES